MKKISKFIWVLAFVLAGYVPAFADKDISLPKAVIDKIRSLEDECRVIPSKTEQIKTAPDVVQRIVQRLDLNGDGLMDFVFSDADVDCDGMAPHGNGGIGIVVLVGTPNGGAKEAYSETVWDFRIEQENAPAKVVLIVGGYYCGQKVFTKATAIICERPLIWDAKTQTFEMGPKTHPSSPAPRSAR